MTVKTILRDKGGDVFSMPPAATLAEVVKELAGRKIGAILIMEDDRLVGILSERDIVRVLADRGGSVLASTASSVMTSRVETCGLDDLIDEVMERMTNSRFRHMPVVNEGKVIGLVSIGDIVKRRIEDALRERDDMKAYIHSM